MVTERHDIASRLIITTMSRNEFEGNINFTGIGTQAWTAFQAWFCQHM